MKRYLFAVAMIAAVGAVVAAEESAPFAAVSRPGARVSDRAALLLHVPPHGDDRRGAASSGRARPNVEEYARRFLELAKTDPVDAAAFEALAWVKTHNPQGREAEEALELLGKNHVKDQRLSPVLQELRTSRSPAAETLLRTALENSPHREVRAQACYSLASHLMAKAPAATGARASQPARSKDEKKEADESTKDPVESSREEAVKLYERLAQDYGDVKVAGRKTYADLARTGLARLRPKAGRMRRTVGSESLPIGLEIAMLAPEITGRDTNGQTMQLSDYRGRVVVLDFWGHW